MNELFRSRFFPLVPQIAALIAFGLLMVGGLLADTGDPTFAKVLRNTNLANLIVWSYWWPLIILAAIFLGRVWCTVCPMELATSLAARVGLKRKPPRVFRSGWIVTAFYIGILVIGIQMLAMHRVPMRMAIYLLVLSGTAVLTGLLFEKNTFCAFVCPVGHLLGLYARVAPFGWGVRDKSVCRSCKDKSCVAKGNLYALQGRSCGVGLRPGALDDNANCLLCGQCLKACDWNRPDASSEERPNPGWFRRPWAHDLLTLKLLSTAQAAFLWVVSGFVVYEILTEWSVSKDMLLFVPNYVTNYLEIDAAIWARMIKAVLLFVVLPCVFWLPPYALFRIRCKMRLVDYMRSWGIAFIPIMAGAHATKSILKMTSRIPYWRNAITDPIGISTANGIVDKTITLPARPEWIDPVVTVAAISLVGVGSLLSWIIVRKLNARASGENRDAAIDTLVFYLIPAIYGGLLFATLFAWRVVYT